MFTSVFPSSIPSRSRGPVQVQVQSSAPPSPSPSPFPFPFAFTPTDPESLYADPWHAQPSLGTPTWSPQSHPTSSSSSSSEHSSPTPSSPSSDHEPETTTKKSTKAKKSTNTNSNSNSASSKSKRSKSDPAQKMVVGKTGKPILAASLKRQLRRQKARARAEPRYIELADGQKLGLGQRRSKYTAILEKLNQDLARVQNELTQEKQRNQHLDQTVQELSQQLNQQTSPSSSTKLQSYHTALQIKSQLMYQHSSQSIYDFFKMSSPVMLVLLDFNLRIIDANQTFLRQSGWTREELIGRRSPIVQMCIFFIPGYDPKKIPIDENDIPPLHGGLPRGIPVEDMQVKPANFPVYHNLYRGKADSITVKDTYLDGKGRLYKSTVTHWLAYYKPEDDNNNNNSTHLPADTARFASMRSGSGSGSDSASSHVYSRPPTKADEAFRELFGKPNPPYLPNKGYPKYHVAMESAYDREYLNPISLSASPSPSPSLRPLSMWNSSTSGRNSNSSNSSSIRVADSESDSDHDHDHDHDDQHTNQQDETNVNVMPWADTKPLHTIAKIADRFTAWRRTLRANRAAAGTSTPAIGMNPLTNTNSSTVPSSSSSSSSSPLDDVDDDDLSLPLPPINPACAVSDACGIVSVLVEKAKKVTTIRKMVKQEELEEPTVMDEGSGHEDQHIQSTTAIAITTIETNNETNTQHQSTTTTTGPDQAQPQRQVQVPHRPVPVSVSVPVLVPTPTLIQPSPLPSTPFPPSPSPYSPLDLAVPLSLPTPPSSSSSSSFSLSSSSSYSSLPPVYNSDPDQDMWFPSSSSLTLTSQSSYESQTRTTFPFRAPSPFSTWGN